MPSLYRHPSYIRGNSALNGSLPVKNNAISTTNTKGFNFTSLSAEKSRRLFVKDNSHHHLHEVVEWNKNEDARLKEYVLHYGIRGFWRQICDK